MKISHKLGEALQEAVSAAAATLLNEHCPSHLEGPPETWREDEKRIWDLITDLEFRANQNIAAIGQGLPLEELPYPRSGLAKPKKGSPTRGAPAIRDAQEEGGRMTTKMYLSLKRRVVDLGYSDMIEWSEGLKPVSDVETFWSEFAWVVLNSGMKEQIARQIWGRVRPAVENGASAGSVFGHKGKAAAIDHVYANREQLLAEYLKAPDKLEYLRSLPWIGGITSYHLAKNYGHDCAKPDRHLVRIAGKEGTHALCARLARASGDRIATVDVVLWRAANLGLV